VDASAGWIIVAGSRLHRAAGEATDIALVSRSRDLDEMAAKSLPTQGGV